MSDPFATQYNAKARKLYDRIINVGFYTISATAATLASGGASTVTLGDGRIAALSSSIVCPSEGRKPTISLKGKILPSPVLSSLELRITNFITDIPLDQYVYVKVQIGYSTELDTSIEGEIVNAYQETPGPDGVTVFYLMLGYYSSWNSKAATLAFPSGTKINTIIKTCASLMGYSDVQTTLSDSLVSQVPYSYSGLVRDFIMKLALNLGINIYPLGSSVRAMGPNDSSTIVHNIRYFKTPPRHDASGYNFVAPFEPSLRPNDIVEVATPYMRQTFGGAQIGTSTTRFITQTIDFDFSTTEDTNEMVVLATAAS